MTPDKFRKWLNKQSREIAKWQDPDLADCEAARDIVDEAAELALRHHFPEAYQVVAKLRGGPIGLSLARQLLSAMLRAIETHTPDGPMSAAQAAEQLGVSREKVYELCRTGALLHDRVGKRITITPEQLEQYQTPRLSAGQFRHL